MTHYHTEEEVRRYDLMKLGVPLLLLALLALTWVATRDQAELAEPVEEEAAATPVAEGGYPAEGRLTAVPVPTLGVPIIDAPDGAQPPGAVILSGSAGPGAQVIILVNGQPAGAAIAGVDGEWSAAIDLPAGSYTVQAQTVDNVGTVVSESEPVQIVVGGEAPTTPGASGAAAFDPITNTYTFSGTAAPGATITILSNGAPVGATTADEAGNWSVAVPADAATGDVQMQVTDATGVTQPAQPVELGPRPPSLSPPAEPQIDPATGAVTLPIQAGSSTWTGQGEPGTQVEIMVDGVSAGTTEVDASGAWSLPLELADGAHTVQLNTLDPSGTVLSSSSPFTVVAGGEAPPGEVEGTTPSPEATAAGATPVAGGETTPQPAATPSAATPAATPVAGEEGTIADVLAGRPEFSTLLSVVETAGMLGDLAAAGSLTVFAPTNEAFERLPQPIIDGLRANPPVLAGVLQYHMTRGRYEAADLRVVQPATLNGRLLTITPQGDTFLVNDATVVEADIPAANGVVHAIDRILVPPLAEGVRPPVIDESGVSSFEGPALTVVGTAEPGRAILVALNGELLGQATVGPDTAWSVAGDVTPGEYQIVAYMLDATGALEAISRPVALTVR
jgi:uncharacterized surface protein with fasciclin (FAS1) repeats